MYVLRRGFHRGLHRGFRRGFCSGFCIALLGIYFDGGVPYTYTYYISCNILHHRG